MPCHEIAGVRRLPPLPHQNTAPVVHHSHSSTPKRTKKPPYAQQESQCVRRLKERIARKGGLWWKYGLHFFKRTPLNRYKIIEDTFFQRFTLDISIIFKSNNPVFCSIRFQFHDVTYFEIFPIKV